MTGRLTTSERDEVLKMLILEARVTGQSILNCTMRGQDMADQLKTARVKESGILKVIEMINDGAEQ